MEPGQTRSQALLIFTNLPDEASAQALATALISERLAACVNILAPCTSGSLQKLCLGWRNAAKHNC